VRVDSDVVIASLTTENDGITIDVSTGTLTVIMSAAATSALNFVHARYDIEIVPPPAGEPYRFMEGRVFLSRETTR
jgi:hypothetical protein